MPAPARVGVLTALLTLSLAACASTTATTPDHEGPGAAAASSPAPRVASQQDAPSAPSAPSDPPTTATPGPSKRPNPAPRMLRATLRIPALRMESLPVVPYRGSPDDGPGTRIQNGGVAASPFGARGGVGPGQVGNYIVTAHRTTSPAPFADLPSLRRGHHVLVRAGGRVFDYRVTRTRSTSFRSRRSLARQSAAVPGRPGVPATRAMITLSTCATPEDHARGNYWADEFGNPEHRIDKIGVLVEVRPARP